MESWLNNVEVADTPQSGFFFFFNQTHSHEFKTPKNLGLERTLGII